MSQALSVRRHELMLSLIVLMAMILASLLSLYMAPKGYLSDTQKIGDLNLLVPESFGPWTVAKVPQPLVNAEVASQLESIYSQTLQKAYTGADGYTVMLTIAYGGDQSRELQVHRPEVCYVSQGFSVRSAEKVQLSLGPRSIPAMHFLATAGSREEPVTYWIKIGNKLVRGNVEQGMARLNYGLAGSIPDGLLFRVSSIDTDHKQAFIKQQKFISDMLSAMTDENKAKIIGR